MELFYYFIFTFCGYLRIVLVKKAYFVDLNFIKLSILIRTFFVLTTKSCYTIAEKYFIKKCFKQILFNIKIIKYLKYKTFLTNI